VFGWMVGGTRGLLQAQHEKEKGKHGGQCTGHR
jgi:hypothetical protein